VSCSIGIVGDKRTVADTSTDVRSGFRIAVLEYRRNEISYPELLNRLRSLNFTIEDQGSWARFSNGTFSIRIKKAMRDVEPPLADISQAPDVLGRIATTLVEIEFLQDEVQALVEQAREAGASWADIGEAAGISRQSAYMRFSERGRETNRANQRKRREAGTS
jgi:hypothetical protein